MAAGVSARRRPGLDQGIGYGAGDTRTTDARILWREFPVGDPRADRGGEYIGGRIVEGAAFRLDQRIDRLGDQS